MKYFAIHSHRYGDSTYYVESDRNLLLLEDREKVEVAKEFGCDFEPEKNESLEFFTFTDQVFIKIP